MNNKDKILSIVSIVILIMMFIIAGVSINCYATIEENNIEKYKVLASEENKFLEDIYKNETESTKIKTIKKDISEENYIEKEIYKTKTLTKKNYDYIYKEFGETHEFDDGEYKGILKISDINIETINNGYYEKIDEKILDFTNYTDNDLNNIEKEIIIDNQKYYLINVKWEVETTTNIDNQEVPITYKGNKIYQTIKQIANPNTYKVTVKYSEKVQKIDTIYDYTIEYEKRNIEIVKENNNNTKPIIIISGIGLVILVAGLVNNKNTYIYSKTDKGFKLIKREKLNDRNVSIDITQCKNKSKIYAIKINNTTFKKLKGRTISLVVGNNKKDIILWNNYYEIKI